ncbi:MAG: hypothetical protein ABI629_13985 [bacterium]
MRRLAAVLVLVFVAACGRSSYQIDAAAPQRPTYSPNEKLRVTLPPAGNQSEEGGRAISGRIVQVLQQTHADVQLLPTNDLTAALADARTQQAAFLVEPTVTKWKAGMAPPFTADQLAVRLDLVNVASGTVVSSVTFETASSLFAASDTPLQTLLDAKFDEAVRALVGSAK